MWSIFKKKKSNKKQHFYYKYDANKNRRRECLHIAGFAVYKVRWGEFGKFDVFHGQCELCGKRDKAVYKPSIFKDERLDFQQMFWIDKSRGMTTIGTKEWYYKVLRWARGRTMLSHHQNELVLASKNRDRMWV